MTISIEEFDYREVANSSELTDIAIALFVGMLDTPAISAGGGGSQSDLPWRDKDDDDLGIPEQGRPVIPA